MAHAALGEFPDAVAALRASLDMTGRDPALLRLLASILSSAPDASVRNGPEAVALLEEAMERGGLSASSGDPSLLDQLAMAYAAAGRFDEAVATERRAIDLAKRTTSQHVLQDFQRRLALYSARTAYIQEQW
jgi:cytochrome c-type biogenesis protein CcmH/NrfG